MAERSDREREIEAIWWAYLAEGHEIAGRRFFRLLPGSPRCKFCSAPFSGIGGGLVRVLYGRQPSTLNPTLCNVCDQMARQHPGGAEVDLSLLFVDVRGSTALAEQMSPAEYARTVNRFYGAASRVMVSTDALIDKIVGDQVAGMYVPGVVGQAHARRALEAAQQILRATGHGGAEGPWIPAGVGVHTGTAFVGAVHSPEGTADITVLGDTPNTAARLSGAAGIGEILVTEATAAAAQLMTGGLEKRTLSLKGKQVPVTAFVLSAESPLPELVGRGSAK
jgi:adenylate cyclase